MSFFGDLGKAEGYSLHMRIVQGYYFSEEILESDGWYGEYLCEYLQAVSQAIYSG